MRVRREEVLVRFCPACCDQVWVEQTALLWRGVLMRGACPVCGGAQVQVESPRPRYRRVSASRVLSACAFPDSSVWVTGACEVRPCAAVSCLCCVYGIWGSGLRTPGVFLAAD